MVSSITEVQGACIMLELHRFSVEKSWDLLWLKKGLYHFDFYLNAYSTQ